jgi:Complex 1 protein (LYR family)
MATVTKSALERVSTRQLFRDLLRAAERVGLANSNVTSLKARVRDEFKRNRYESEPQKVQELRESAILALSNYVVMEAQNMAKMQGHTSIGDAYLDTEDTEGADMEVVAHFEKMAREEAERRRNNGD